MLGVIPGALVVTILVYVVPHEEVHHTHVYLRSPPERDQSVPNLMRMPWVTPYRTLPPGNRSLRRHVHPRPRPVELEEVSHVVRPEWPSKVRQIDGVRGVEQLRVGSLLYLDGTVK